MKISSWTLLLQGVMQHQGHPASKHHPHLQRSSKVTVNADGVASPACLPWLRNVGRWVTGCAGSHKAPGIFCFSCLLARRGEGMPFLPNANLTDTDGNGLGILWSPQVSSPSGRLLPWACWQPQSPAPPEERGGVKTALHLQGARKGSWKGMG